MPTRKRTVNTTFNSGVEGKLMLKVALKGSKSQRDFERHRPGNGPLTLLLKIVFKGSSSQRDAGRHRPGDGPLTLLLKVVLKVALKFRARSAILADTARETDL